MSHYSQVLQSILEEHFDGEQSSLARAAKVAQSMLSRHCRDEKQPDSLTLLKICAVVPSAAQSRLVVAFLRDLCPPSVQHLVSIQEVSTSSPHVLRETTKTSDHLARLDPATRKAIERLVERALTQPGTKDLLRATDRFITGRG